MYAMSGTSAGYSCAPHLGDTMNARTLYLIKEEVTRLQNQLAVSVGIKVRAVASVTRHLLLQGPYFYNGRRCNPKAKSLGAGAYEIWLDDE